ncbi:hypothetical protein Bbelb_035800 [Branchiostoma belcheri]|nr:hypothetical protein Bbelb_035800 [Branchiostoma belcheri]
MLDTERGALAATSGNNEHCPPPLHTPDEKEEVRKTFPHIGWDAVRTHLRQTLKVRRQGVRRRERRVSAADSNAAAAATPPPPVRMMMGDVELGTGVVVERGQTSEAGKGHPAFADKEIPGEVTIDTRKVKIIDFGQACLLSDARKMSEPLSESEYPWITPEPMRSCKYCGKKHLQQKEACPAYGKQCLNCQGRNHFATVCKSADRKPRRGGRAQAHMQKTKVHVVEEENYVMTITTKTYSMTHPKAFGQPIVPDRTLRPLPSLRPGVHLPSASLLARNNPSSPYKGVDGNVEEGVGRQSVKYKPAISLFLEDEKDGGERTSRPMSRLQRRYDGRGKPKKEFYDFPLLDTVRNLYGIPEIARQPQAHGARIGQGLPPGFALKKPGKMGLDKLQQLLVCKDDLLVKVLSNEAAAGSPPFEEATVSTETATATSETATATTETATATTETATATSETATATTETATATSETATATTETATATTETATATSETATATSETANATAIQEPPPPLKEPTLQARRSQTELAVRKAAVPGEVEGLLQGAKHLGDGTADGGGPGMGNCAKASKGNPIVPTSALSYSSQTSDTLSIEKLRVKQFSVYIATAQFANFRYRI